MARIRIDFDFVQKYSTRYAEDSERLTPAAWALECELFGPIHGAVRAQGYLTPTQLRKISEWKSPRQRTRIKSNPEGLVRRVTEVAFAPTNGERASTLTTLNGVLEPMASAILTVWNPYEFTVYDYRARATLQKAGEIPKGPKRVSYGYYLDVCRRLAASLQPIGGEVPLLRLLDRALWQYAKSTSLG